jgi:hypothetical protein
MLGASADLILNADLETIMCCAHVCNMAGLDATPALPAANRSADQELANR